MRARLKEAQQAVAEGNLKATSPKWIPQFEIKKAIRDRNAQALRWFLKMVRKEYGEEHSHNLMQPWLASEHAAWILVALKES